MALFSGNYNYTRDGANKALNRLVAHVLELGGKIRVYSPTSAHPAFDPVGDLVSVPSVSIPGRSEFRIALGLPSGIAANVQAFAPNIVHVSAPDWLGTGAQRLARKLNVPLVASMHTRFETYFDYYGLHWLHGWALRRQQRFYQASDRVLAPNEASKQHLIRMGVPSERIGIWSRGVEHDLFSPARRDWGWRRSLGFSDDEPILLFFGRVVREKGTACFVEAVKELRSRGMRVRPVIVGEGPARAEIEASICDAVFVGHLDGAQLARAVASADILLNPSLTEAFGNVNLEAMAAGLTVVTADVGSASNIITDGEDGYLCEASPRFFADVIANLWTDDAARKRVGESAVATARKYQWSESLDAVVRIYRQLTRI